MEVSALQHAGLAGTYGRSPLLRLQSDERLIALIRRGNHHAFEALVSRYSSRLHSFCRHMLGSNEDAEDVLQEVFAAAFNAIQADDRPLNVRPWLYRIARNRSLNHLRRKQAIGVDSMDVHFADQGATTADKVHKREDFRMLLVDVQGLPETQRTALLLREIDALSYDQIAGAMETTIPSVKSLLVRARVALAEAAEARLLSCEDVRTELGEVAEGLKRVSPPVRRHLKTCDRCSAFRTQLKATNKALAAVFPIGPLLLLKKLAITHLGTSASAGSASTAAGGATTAAAGTAAGTAAAGSAAGGLLSAGASAVATKAAAGLAAAAIVTAGAVEVKQAAVDHPSSSGLAAAITPRAVAHPVQHKVKAHNIVTARKRHEMPKPAIVAQLATTPAPAPVTTIATPPPDPPKPPTPDKTQTVSDTTRLPTETSTTPTTSTTPAAPPGEAGQPGGSTPPAPPAGEGGPAPTPPTTPTPPPPGP